MYNKNGSIPPIQVGRLILHLETKYPESLTYILTGKTVLCNSDY